MKIIQWDEAEKLFPECSAAWDCEGGPVWADPSPVFALIIFGPALYAVACNYYFRGPYRWAIYNDDICRWIFITTPGYQTLADGILGPRLPDLYRADFDT